MGFKHKNILGGTISIHDSKGVRYDMKPNDEVELDMDASYPGGGIVLVEEGTEDKHPRKKDRGAM